MQGLYCIHLGKPCSVRLNDLLGHTLGETMKYETAKLSGAMLDAAVAKGEGRAFKIAPYRVSGDYGITFVRSDPVCVVDSAHFEPSSSWSQGGPIIEREGVETWKWKGEDGAYWCAHVGGRRVGTNDKESLGGTLLVAAMRAFVHARCGYTVDL